MAQDGLGVRIVSGGCSFRKAAEFFEKRAREVGGLERQHLFENADFYHRLAAICPDPPPGYEAQPAIDEIAITAGPTRRGVIKPPQ